MRVARMAEQFDQCIAEFCGAMVHGERVVLAY